MTNALKERIKLAYLEALGKHARANCQRPLGTDQSDITKNFLSEIEKIVDGEMMGEKDIKGVVSSFLTPMYKDAEQYLNMELWESCAIQIGNITRALSGHIPKKQEEHTKYCGCIECYRKPEGSDKI